MVTLTKKCSRPPPIVRHNNIIPNNPNCPYILKILKVCQKIKRIWKEWRSIRWYYQKEWRSIRWYYQKEWRSIRWYYQKLRNGTHILLYFKMSKHPVRDDTLQYHCLWKKLIESAKTAQILWWPLNYWKMGLSFYCTPRSQTLPSWVTHLYSNTTIQTATICSLELGNIKGLRKKLTKSEKNIKIFEKH